MFDEKYMFAALIGDLEHKITVYTQAESRNDQLALILITNCCQAHWLRKLAPEKIPNDQLNCHSLGTIFEYAYRTDFHFRANVDRGLCAIFDRSDDPPPYDGSFQEKRGFVEYPAGRDVHPYIHKCSRCFC